MSTVVMTEQAQSILIGVDEYIPDLDTRVLEWRSAFDTLPLIPEDEIKQTMQALLSAVRTLPTTKGLLGSSSAASTAESFKALASALQNTLYMHQQNTMSAQNLRSKCNQEESTIKKHLSTLRKQDRQITEEGAAVHGNMMEMQDQIETNQAQISTYKEELSGETSLHKVTSYEVGRFMNRGVMDSEGMASLDKHIKELVQEIEDCETFIKTSEEGQDERNQALERIIIARSEIRKRKPEVAKELARSDDFLRLSMSKQTALDNASRSLRPYMASSYDFAQASVVELYEALLKVTENAVLSKSVIPEGGAVLSIVQGLPFAGELKASIQAAQHAVSNVE